MSKSPPSPTAATNIAEKVKIEPCVVHGNGYNSQSARERILIPICTGPMIVQLFCVFVSGAKMDENCYFLGLEGRKS